MIILITGAAGFIGSQLAYRLYKSDYKIVLIDNFSYGYEDNLYFDDHDFTNEVIKLDIRDKDGIKSIFEKYNFDIVYNFAGIAPLPDCQLNPTEAVDVNVNGFVNILENARIFGCKNVIQASTNALYENEKTFPTTEDNYTHPSLIYPTTKHAAESFARAYCSSYGMNVTCLRFVNVYGPHIDCLRKQPPFIAYMIRELYYNRTPIFHSDGNQRRDYIYVDDLLDLAVLVQKSKGFLSLNVSSNQNYSVNELFSMTKKIMNKNITCIYADDKHYWQNYKGLFEGKYIISMDILNHEINKETLCSNQLAYQKFKWRPMVSMEEGLTRVVESVSKFMKNRDQ